MNAFSIPAELKHREYNVALALTDTSFMPRPWEMKDGLDLVTADFAYVRCFGDRKGIEEITRTWDKTVVDLSENLSNWVGLVCSDNSSSAG